MISRDNYSEEHIRLLQQQSHKDPQLIERALYALGLLEALKQTGMQFIFKGGSSIVISSRGKVGKDDYPIYVEGIRGVATHVYSERYSGEIASYRAANIIYMAACLLTETPYITIDRFEDYADEPLKQADLQSLTRMKKAQPLQYAYLVKADRLLGDYRNHSR